MSVTLQCAKDRMAYFLECLRNGHAVEAGTEGPWLPADALALAGACLFYRSTFGTDAPIPTDDEEELAEANEAYLELLHREMHGAIAWLAETAGILDEDTSQYDEELEPECHAEVVVTEDHDVMLKPLAGFRDLAPGEFVMLSQGRL